MDVGAVTGRTMVLGFGVMMEGVWAKKSPGGRL